MVWLIAVGGGRAKSGGGMLRGGGGWLIEMGSTVAVEDWLAPGSWWLGDCWMCMWLVRIGGRWLTLLATSISGRKSVLCCIW